VNKSAPLARFKGRQHIREQFIDKPNIPHRLTRGALEFPQNLLKIFGGFLGFDKDKSGAGVPPPPRSF
jgi:hypothetical protein